ncbi:MAG: hypothetical protein ACYTG7_03065 [Planctomycetota bacterium]
MKIHFILALLLMAPLAMAQNMASDDFNRPDGTNMGPDWAEMEGNTVIESNQGKGSSGPWMLGWMYHTNFEGHYADSIQSVEFFANQGSENVRLMSGLNPNTWGCVSVKIQDNDMDGSFDRVFFESAINAGNWGNLGVPVWYDLADQTNEGKMTLYFDNDGDRAVCEIENTASGKTETFTAEGILTFPYPIDGSNFGIGHYNFPYFDNWHVELLSMRADASTVSETGGTVNLTLDAGSQNGNRNYLIVGGVTGTEPGTALPGGLATLPVNWDTFSDVVMLLMNSGVFSNFLGTLDSSGQASAQLNVPALPSGYVGTIMYFAYCCNSPFDFASNAIEVEIVP